MQDDIHTPELAVREETAIIECDAANDVVKVPVGAAFSGHKDSSSEEKG